MNIDSKDIIQVIIKPYVTGNMTKDYSDFIVCTNKYTLSISLVLSDGRSGRIDDTVTINGKPYKEFFKLGEN